MNNLQTIELDCAPGHPRPDSLLAGVLAGTGIKPEQLKCVGKCFGNWTYEIPEELTEQYLAVKEKVASAIKALYNVGAIRYGSW